jgi:hypothetical protein
MFAVRSAHRHGRSAAFRVHAGAETAHSHSGGGAHGDERCSIHHGPTRAASSLQSNGRLRVHEHDRGVPESRGKHQQQHGQGRSARSNGSAASVLIVVGERRLLGGRRPRYECLFCYAIEEPWNRLSCMYVASRLRAEPLSARLRALLCLLLPGSLSDFRSGRFCFDAKASTVG